MSGKDDFLLDTNVVLGFLNGHFNIKPFFEKHINNNIIYVSQITRMELLGFPSITVEEEKLINHFISLIKILPISDEVCNHAINTRKKYRLKLPDALIAATAICYKLKLITCDRDLLINIEGLRSFNPVTE